MVLNTAQMSLEDPCHPMIPDMFVSGKSQQIYVDLHLGRASEIALVLGVSPHFDAMVGFRPRWDGKIHYHWGTNHSGILCW